MTKLPSSSGPPPSPDEAALERKILERFLRYVTVWTTSDSSAETTPSTPGQWELARLLEAELRGMGIETHISGHCYLIARIPANSAKELPALGFLAHLDTSEEVSGKGVRPAVHKDADGRTVISSAGDTLLGADDKAGIAEIVTAAEYIAAHPEIEHGEIELIFTPDEETGKGLPCFPHELVHARMCFTVDGGAEGELEIECFNAYGADVRFRGYVTHPGAARGKLVNAALMAASYAAMLPRTESPEATDGLYGYYCVMALSGRHDEASLQLILRDFSMEGMKRRIAALDALALAVEAQFPGGSVKVAVKESYLNMREKIEASPETLEKLRRASERLGIACRFKPVRGGTDGARLCALGIPTPNIWTGGRSFHSTDEWACLEEMASACRMIIELMKP